MTRSPRRGAVGPGVERRRRGDRRASRARRTRLGVGLGVAGEPEHRGGERPGREAGDERVAARASAGRGRRGRARRGRPGRRARRRARRDLELVLVVVGAGGERAEPVVAARRPTRRAGSRRASRVERGVVRDAQVARTRRPARAPSTGGPRPGAKTPGCFGERDAGRLEAGLGSERDPIGLGEERRAEQLGDPVEREEPHVDEARACRRRRSARRGGAARGPRSWTAPRR